MPIAKIGSEFLVNTSTLNNQIDSYVAGLTGGGFVVTYNDFSLASDFAVGSDIRARIFDANGNQTVAEFVVNTTTRSNQTDSSIAALGNGRFVVTYTDVSQTGGDNNGEAIRARVFNTDGTQAAPEFLVNTTTENTQQESSVAVLNDGRIVVSYTDWSGRVGDTDLFAVRARIVNANGSPSVGEFLVNQTTADAQYLSSTTVLSNGLIVIAFTDNSSTGGDQSLSAIRARIFNPNGTQAVPEFLVNTSTASAQDEPQVAALDNGRFVVSYDDAAGPNFSNVRARIFNSDGSQAVPEFQVNSTITDSQFDSSIAVLADGRIAFVFTDSSRSPDDASNTAVRARIFNADGTPSGPDFLVNSTTLGQQFDSGIAALADGRFVVTFTDNSRSPDDPTDYAIRAQIYDPRVFNGLATADRIVGARLGDTLSGLGGNDTLISYAGADSLSGNADNDVLIGDGPLSLTPEAQSIRRLYIATLDRAPDDGGWIGWATQREGGTSLDTIAAGFVNSKEFQAKYGDLDNTQFVTRLYNNVLDRNPDAGGLAAYVNALNGGALTRTQVVTTFSESREFADGTSNTINAGQVYRLYGATLGRAPDGGGFETWTDALGSGRALVDIAAGFVNSTEFQAKYGLLNNDDFVTLLYQNVLGRGPDAGGLAFWTGQLGSGAQSRTQVVTGFSESLEYINGTRPGVDAFMRNVMTAWSDTLIGGAGDDKMTGGRGADRYVFLRSEAGNDTVYGFDSFDTLELRGFGYANSAQALAAMSQQGADVLFSFGDGSVRFIDTQLSQLQSLPAQGWVFG